MRVIETADEFSVQAYSGTSGVLLAMNVSPRRRKGLLGFAVEKQEAGEDWEMLCGMLHFPQIEVKPGALVPTDKGPIQKFRWSDYRVHAHRDYGYRVHPVYGDWRKPEIHAPIELKVHTASLA